MSVNVPRLMETLTHQGDLLSEIVKNALEAINCTNVVVTIDRVNKLLIVQNDGDPVLDPEKYLLEIFTTGKDPKKNHGKGGSTVLMEESAEWRTGEFNIVEHKWDDVDTYPDLPFVPGCTVTVHLKENSPILLKEDSAHYVFLCKFRTTKKLVFNGVVVNTTPLPDLSQWEQPLADIYAMIPEKLFDIGNWFILSDGSYGPIEVSNAPECALLIGDVKYLDTERGKLEWETQYRLNNWFKKKMQDTMNDVQSEAVSVWMNKYLAPWLTTLFKNTGTLAKPIDFTGITYHDASQFAYLSEKLNDIADKFDIEHFSWGKDMEDNPRKTIERMRNDNWYYTRLAFTQWIGDPIEVLSFLSIGVMIAAGEVIGQALMKDLPVSKLYTADITSADMWAVLKRIEGPLIATHTDIRPYIETYTADIDALKRANEVIVEMPKMEECILASAVEVAVGEDGFINIEGDKGPDEGDDAADDVEAVDDRELDYTLQEKEGVNFFVHESRNIEKMKLVMERQKYNYNQWCAAIKVIMEHTKGAFTKSCMPVVTINAKSRSDYATSIAPYVGIDYHTRLPENKTNRMMVLMMLGVHELAHAISDQHTQKFYKMVEDACLALANDEGFMSKLRQAI